MQPRAALQQPGPSSAVSPRGSVNTLALCAWLCIAATGLAGCYRRHTEQSDLTGNTTSSAAPRQTPYLRKPSVAALDGPETEPPSAESPSTPETPAPRVPTTPGLKVAIFGDQSVGAHAAAVLQLVAQERADMIVHLGDFAYDASPAAWDAQIDSVLGPNFPYFAVIGNHDVPDWQTEGGFAQRLNARLSRIDGAQCRGEYAVNSSCTYRGLHFVLSGVGTYGSGHEAFLQDALTHSDALHSLCLWHKNQHDLQVGAKPDEVGWAAYQICAAHGAPVFTGHEHSYARTYTLSRVGDRSSHYGAQGDPANLVLGAGRTFVVVSGLGGHSARDWTSDHKDDSWWASIYAGHYQLRNGQRTGSEPTVDYGALFVTFGVDGDPAKAVAYFKTIGGQVADDFTWRRD